MTNVILFKVNEMLQAAIHNMEYKRSFEKKKIKKNI